MQNVCETIIRTAVVPAISSLFDAFSKQLAEVMHKQTEVQRALLDQLSEASRYQGRPLVTVNTAPRRDSDLDRINIDAPRNAEEEAQLRGNVVPVSRFLKDMWQPAWRRAGVKHSSCLMQFSVLLHARKLRAIREAGEEAQYAGQIGRNSLSFARNE